jgi:polyphosphate kinase
VTAIPPPPTPAPTPPTDLFLNRELSWLQFNRRVLEEAMDPSNPVLERVKFLAITSTNLDEFFEVRVAGTMELIEAGLPTENPGNLSPREELAQVRQTVTRLYEDMHRCWREQLLPALREHGIRIVGFQDMDDRQRAWCDAYFRREVLPVLTPLAVDPAHPFPSLLNKSLNVAVLLGDNRRGTTVHRIAVVQVPRVLARFVRLPDQEQCHVYVMMADLVRQNAALLFPGLEVLHVCSFRVTRDGNLDFDEEESGDLLSAIEKELVERRRGEPVRLEVRTPHPELLARFGQAFGLEPEDIYVCDGPVNLGRLMELYRTEDGPGLKDAIFVPRRATEWAGADAMFAQLRAGDVTLHHPYDSFATVEEFVRHSARDPRVLAIKQTIYRAGEDSGVVEDLIVAAQNRKQVTVVVELQARFDEEANIRWAKRLERAGVHVVYGIVGLKTHAKALLVVRREEDGLRRYCHVGTGNYNPTTARVYTDVGLLTAREDLTQDVADLFNMITGYARVPAMSQLVVAPFDLRAKLLAWIEREAQHARSGRPSGIRAKMNGVQDEAVIRALYAASQAGVRIELIVRGICCLRPGVPGLSERISVVSIVDRFLEHSRVWYFENGGQPQVYLSSADWMKRNLDRRIEIAVPVLDPQVRRRLVDEVLGYGLRDDLRARRLEPDGTHRRPPLAPGATGFRSQVESIEQARRAGKPLELQPGSKPERATDRARRRLRMRIDRRSG